MDLGLAGKVVAVAGASKGIGYACAEAFAREGAAVALVSRSAPNLEAALGRIKQMVNDPKAIAYTEAPESVNMFLRQRFRWNYGIMQCFWKHKDTLFNSKYQWLGWAALPNLLFFQLLLPIIAPLADLITIIGLLMGNGMNLLGYYLLFLSVETLSAAVAFSFEGESKKRLIWLIPQRFYYRQIMYYVAIKSLNKAIRGGVMSWGVLKRTGNVKMKQV